MFLCSKVSKHPFRNLGRHLHYAFTTNGGLDKREFKRSFHAIDINLFKRTCFGFDFSPKVLWMSVGMLNLFLPDIARVYVPRLEDCDKYNNFEVYIVPSCLGLIESLNSQNGRLRNKGRAAPSRNSINCHCVRYAAQGCLLLS